VPRSVSILVPTHDRAELLVRSLASLRRLSIPHGVEVEALVVANACTDDTEERVRKEGRSFPFPLRVIPEPVPGLNVARNRGAGAARGEILAYLDDDAFVEPEWLAALVRTYDELPADLVAGRVILWWEAVERPSWSSPAVERLLSYLDLGPEPLELPRPGQLVGANFAVRRRVLEDLGGFVSHLDRHGFDLLSGGDTELAIRAKRSGKKIYYSPEMTVHHWVAPSRLSRDYLDRIALARGRTRVALARTVGSFSPWRLLRAGCRQTIAGTWREVRYRIVDDRRRSTEGRVTRLRGTGTLRATLESLGRRCLAGGVL
jgi:GT2 family glycosyltransferase